MLPAQYNRVLNARTTLYPGGSGLIRAEGGENEGNRGGGRILPKTLTLISAHSQTFT